MYDDKIIRICEIFRDFYGEPRLGNPYEPIDDAIYIILSNRTPPSVSQRVFEALKTRFSRWEDLINAELSEVFTILMPSGMAHKRAIQIRSLLEKVSRDFGSLNLDILRNATNELALQYLTSLPGLSVKGAKCVMLFTLGMQVLPVDRHVYRVSIRLGLSNAESPESAQDEIERKIPPHLRYSYHVDCIEHGREICRPRNPKCEQCPVTKWCDYFQERHQV